ncbi:2OG-Fe(II) oxygenase [Alphaproteobacteria bacterium]|nr:2OG-Fe(II) oxygenase [Alphaproteobacteria bacterium]
MSAIDLDGFSATSLVRNPYDHLIVPGFLTPDAVAHIDADFPVIQSPGSFPLETLSPGPAFLRLMEELRGEVMRRAFSEKFGTDLNPYPTTITVRGHCQAKDGAIHTDTPSKILTILIYMNSDALAGNGGRLRILRSKTDLSNYAAEVPTDAGTLLAFRRGDQSYHGHESFVGTRRVIQLNWVTDMATVRREQRRHRLSAWTKSLFYQGKRKG